MFKSLFKPNLTGLLFLFIFSLGSFLDSESHACTAEVKVHETIGPATLDLVQRVKAFAHESQCNSIALLINTPGGSLQSTRLIVEEIINSSIPFLCLVAPRGGHAGSAGAIILQACHVSGALSSTNIGAATPVASTGQEIPEDLRKKLINDTKSWVESLTDLRKRNKQFGQDIITEAKAVSAEEAFKLKAIDILADSISNFYTKAQGKIVLVGKDKQIEKELNVGGVREFTPGLRHEVVSLITDPQIAYMMFMGSLGLIYFEITHPGMLVPGVVGGIGLIVSMMSLHKLNVEMGGLALLLLGLILMVAEAFVASFGILGIGGVVSFFLGSLFLFDPHTSGHSIPMPLILGTTLLVGLLMFSIAYLAWSTRLVRVKKGQQDMLGQTGVSVEAKSETEGLMEVVGEIWKYESSTAVKPGDKLKIVEVRGLTLLVKPNVQ